MFRFYSGLIKFRHEHPLLGRAEFLTDADVTWHEDRWGDPESRFLARPCAAVSLSVHTDTAPLHIPGLLGEDPSDCLRTVRPYAFAVHTI